MKSKPQRLQGKYLRIVVLYILLSRVCFAADSAFSPSYGRVNSDKINIRSDSSTNAPLIFVAPKDETLEVILEKYDWYKIKLPKTAPSFVKKDLLEAIDSKTAKVLKERVNIRLLPDETAVILGKLEKNEVVAVLEESGGWYKIEPTDNCFGWIHKKFVDKVLPAAGLDKPVTTQVPSAETNAPIQLQGIIQPYGKVINRIATHKLVTKDYNIFLLKGNSDSLNTFTYHRVKITGRTLASVKQKYPVIEIIKMEALD